MLIETVVNPACPFGLIFTRGFRKTIILTMARSTTKSDSYKKIATWAAIGIGAFFASRAIKELTKYKLKDKVVLITGGSRGLGLVLARQLATKGAKLAICARSLDQLQVAEQQLEEQGARVLAIPADVTDRAQVEEMVNEVIDHYGKLDVLINNAGVVHVGPVDAMGIEEYEEAMKTHFWGPLYAILAVIPHFKSRRKGRIVNITSIGGKIAVPHLLPYTVSKFALVGLSEGLHVELKKHNIHVTTVVPNLMRTGSPRHATLKGNHEAEYAWFKASGSSPLLSQETKVAAREIIKAIEYSQAEPVLSATAKVMTVLKGVAPGWVNVMLSLANKLLPNNTPYGTQSKKGYESETELSVSLGTQSDKAAKRNNEI